MCQFYIWESGVMQSEKSTKSENLPYLTSRWDNRVSTRFYIVYNLYHAYHIILFIFYNFHIHTIIPPYLQHVISNWPRIGVILIIICNKHCLKLDSAHPRSNSKSFITCHPPLLISLFWILNFNTKRISTALWLNNWFLDIDIKMQYLYLFIKILYQYY